MNYGLSSHMEVSFPNLQIRRIFISLVKFSPNIIKVWGFMQYQVFMTGGFDFTPLLCNQHTQCGWQPPSLLQVPLWVSRDCHICIYKYMLKRIKRTLQEHILHLDGWNTLFKCFILCIVACVENTTTHKWLREAKCIGWRLCWWSLLAEPLLCWRCCLLYLHKNEKLIVSRTVWFHRSVILLE